MNQRERFKRTMRFQPVDRVPFWDYGYWEENREVWQNEGLPSLVTNIEEFFGFCAEVILIIPAGASE